MKRVNIFLSDECLKELDSILEKVEVGRKGSYWISSLSRGDLVRFALWRTFGIKFKWVHCSGDRVLEKLKGVKAIKESQI